MRIIRYTVNACLVIVGYTEKHTTDRTEIANLESKVAFNFLPKGKNMNLESERERELYACVQDQDACEARRLNDSANVDGARSFSESGESRWKVAG